MKRPTKTLSGVARAMIAVLAALLCAGSASAGDKGSNQVREIKVSQQGNQTIITVVGSARPTFTAFKLSTPKRLVVDLADSRVRGVPSVVDASTALISGVAVSQYTSGGVSVSRVMVNFRKEAAYRVRARGNDLVITLTGGPEGADQIDPPDDGTDEEIARAQAEAAAAREELAQAKTEADKANQQLGQTASQIESLEAEAEKFKAQAEEARKQAEQAKKVLEQARTEADAKEKSHQRSVAAAEKSAASQIAKLRSEIGHAESQIEAEQAKRQRLEKRLAELRDQLEAASREKDRSEKARQKAEAEAEQLKVRAVAAAVDASEAKQEAKEALVQQKRAAEAYQKAAEGEKVSLLEELRQRERESVEAKRKLSAAHEKKDLTEQQLGSALAALRSASSEARKAAKTKKRLEAKTRRELARAERDRRAAERAAEKARQRAEQAAAAKEKAEQEVAAIRADAKRTASAAERRAAAAVAKAEEKLTEAEQARASADREARRAEKHARSLEQQLESHKKRADRAEAHARDLARQLEQYKAEAGRSGKQVASYAKQLKVYENKTKSAERKVASYDKQIEELRGESERAAARAAKYSRELEEFKSSSGRAQKKTAAYAEKVEQLEVKVGLAEKRARDFERQLEKAARESRRKEQQLKDYEAKYKSAERKAASLSKQIDELERKARSAERKATSYDKQVDKLRRESERAAVRAAKYARELEEFKGSSGRAQKKTAAYAKKVEQLEAKAGLAEKRTRDFEQQLEELDRESRYAGQRLAKYEEQIAELGQQARSAQSRAEQYERQLARARDATAQFEDQVAEYEGELRRVKAEAARAEKGAKQALNAEARASKAYKRAAENEKAKLRKVLEQREREAREARARLEKAKQTIAEQERRLTALTEAAEKRAAPEPQERSPKPAAASGSKLTQEQIRLQRLAEMRGEPGVPTGEPDGAVDKGSSAAQAPMITDIEFRSDGDVQRVTIRMSEKVEYSKSTDANGASKIVLRGVGLGPMLERTLDVTDFGGAIERINSFRDGDGVEIDIEVGRLANNEIARKGKDLEWVFTARRPKAKAKGGTKVAAKSPARGTESRTVAREDEGAYEYPMDRTAAYAVALKGKGQKKKRYSGRRIDLDFKDADIHNILRLLADVGHVNIVTADDVSGTVTIRMRNVPWDHALDVILQAKHLGMVREGNLIRVAPLATLEKEREMEIARRKQNQALEPLETRLIPVSYAQAEELRPRADDLLSDRGKLSVDARTNVIIARDVSSALDQIEALIRNLDTQTPQVLIEGRIVEASSNYAREIGIQWGGDFSASTATANPTGLAFPSTVGMAGGATDSQTPTMGLSPVAGARPNPNFAVNLPASVGTGSGGALGITLGSITNNANLNFRLSALEEEGTLRILSSPKILTLDNREAHIEQGTLIPYSRISAQGIQTSFKEAKLNLTVTPHVTADGSVLMNVSMTRDEPDFNNKGARGDPTILKREAETELLVSDGHTAVIGGIFTRNHGTSYKKVPFFGDIPILGWLFKSRTDSDRRSEMLIFITPRIVNRAESIGQ